MSKKKSKARKEQVRSLLGVPACGAGMPAPYGGAKITAHNPAKRL